MKKSKFMKRIGAFTLLTLLTASGLICETKADNENPITSNPYTPRVIVSGYKVSQEMEAGKEAVVDQVEPGKKFSLDVKIKNESTVSDAYSIMVTYTSDEVTLRPVYGYSNQTYISKLEPGQEETISLKYEASTRITTSSVPVNLSIRYVGGDGISYSNESAVIQIPIKLQATLNIQSYSIPERTILGSRSRISATYENIGTDELRDVKMIIKVTGMDDTVVNIGTVAAETVKTQEQYINFAQSGSVTVTIRFTYTNSEGETQEIQTEDAVVSVYSDAASAGENVVPGDGSSSSSTAFFIFAIVIGIGVLAALVVVLLRKNRK